MWSASPALEDDKRVVIRGHKKQRLAVREGVAGPGVHAPGLASALNAGGLWLAPRRPTFKKQARGLGNFRLCWNTDSGTVEKGMGPRGIYERLQF